VTGALERLPGWRSAERWIARRPATTPTVDAVVVEFIEARRDLDEERQRSSNSNAQIDSVDYPLATPQDLDATVKLVEHHDRRIAARRAMSETAMRLEPRSTPAWPISAISTEKPCQRRHSGTLTHTVLTPRGQTGSASEILHADACRVLANIVASSGVVHPVVHPSHGTQWNWS
jgi:hypothetical protein